MAYTEKSYQQIVQDITEYIINNSSAITDYNIGSVLRTLIESYGNELSNEDKKGLYQQLTEVYNATRLSTATGDDLDELAKLLGIERSTGAKATTNVSFIRTTQPAEDFDITSGSIISTQPETGNPGLRYTVTNTTTFDKSITDEEQTFYDGIYKYKLNQRFIDTVNQLTATVSGSSTNLTQGSDYELIEDYEDKIIDGSTIAVLDNCDATTNWNSSSDATTIAQNTSDYKEGTASLDLGKDGTSTNYAEYYKTVSTSRDVSTKDLIFWLYVNDLTNINQFEVRLGSSNSDYITWTLSNGDVTTGWNRIILNPDNATYEGAPILSSVDYIYIKIVTDTSSNTLTSGDIKIDFFTLAETENYEGDIINFLTKPDDGTTFYTDYNPLSVEVPVIAEEIGTDYNVSKGNIVFMVTAQPKVTRIYNYNSATGGQDQETDEELRDRVTEAPSVAGRATQQAIESNILNLDYVKSVNVEDMPLKSVTDESYTYDTGTDLYQLNYEVAQQEGSTVTSISDSLASDITDSDTTITLNDATGFSSSGKVLIDNEVITYTGISTNDLTGCTRGEYDTTATSHTSGTTVEQWFAPDEDYTITRESKIDWSGATNEPNDGDTFYVDYDYRWLGHINVFVVGFDELSSDQLTEITNEVDENLKAAGIEFQVTEPTFQDVNITVDVAIESGYTFSTVKKNIINAVEDYMENLNIGEDVRLSQIYKTIQEVTGVDYSNITSPSSDVTIGENEKARAGSVTVNQI